MISKVAEKILSETSQETKNEVKKYADKLILSSVVTCTHPFSKMVSGDEGDFCIACQEYLNSYRL